MKNEIVTPAGANGEAVCRRRFAAVAVRAALACLGAMAVQPAAAAPQASCDDQLTRLIVPALRQTAMNRRDIRADVDERDGDVYRIRLFTMPDHPGTPNRDATIGWVTLDTQAMRALDVTRDPDRPDVLKIDRRALSRFVSTCVAPATPAAPVRNAVDCDALNRRAQAQGEYVTGGDAGRVVTGQGRLTFYSAPDDACRIDGLFIVEHDHVDARSGYGRFTSVVYLNPRTRGIAEGWVPTARLKPDGTGIAPRQP
ncbi:hypothetical protein [Burkholderia lata]|uniref:Lipoprotein n=1 Tax=Burkholderia lata (strain ATCC 17760 / DSM 23089 / LMG 22485 / NCIMB 9086 / R18194 / 383) TaxID=482957 RepID=A0A6P2LQS9_BURL3|nr:hypothetical protein [Burkholderia lata]VWB63758.1 hypothetical protein BLA15816_03003 [Burkholderia lata]VWB71927.1 hypothetical protein BLA15945_03427 [Burkholderia lata]